MKPKVNYKKLAKDGAAVVASYFGSKEVQVPEYNEKLSISGFRGFVNLVAGFSSSPTLLPFINSLKKGDVEGMKEGAKKLKELWSDPVFSKQIDMFLEEFDELTSPLPLSGSSGLESSDSKDKNESKNFEESEGEGSKDSEDPSESSPKESASDLLKELSANIKKSKPNVGKPVKEPGDGYFRYEPKVNSERKSNWATESIEKFLGQSSTQKQIMQLRRYFDSKRKVTRHSDVAEGRIDPARLVKAYRFDPYHKYKLEKNADIDTAVSILVDMSGSMIRYCKYVLAAQATLALAKALDGVVPYEVKGFTTFYEIKTRDQKALEMVLKPFNKSYNHLKSSILGPYADLFNYRNVEIGKKGMIDFQNSDAESIEVAYSDLKNRPEKRKIIIVISDGHPTHCFFGYGKAYGPSEGLKKLVQFIEKDPEVQIGALGVYANAPEKYYSKCRLTYKPEEVTPSFLSLFKELQDEFFREGGRAYS